MCAYPLESDGLTPRQIPHPRTIGWLGTVALAMGGSNQSLFLIAALFVGQGDILGQGSAAVPLLIVGLILSWIAAPGWTELIMMFPDRVGGIAACCSEAFRPYSPVLSNLTGVCYWWGWVPTCGLTAILSASAIHEWYLPGLPVTLMAIVIVLFFTFINLCGIRWVTRMAIPIATVSAFLAFVSGLAPIVSGRVDWQQATTFHLTTPFPGWFGQLTSLMAGLYLIGFAAPAFEAAACHVGETVNPNKNVPLAMLVSAIMAGVFFLLLPLVWLGVLGPEPLGKDLMLVLGPTFAPVFGSGAKAAAIWFMTFNMFHGTLQPLAGAARTLSQLADDDLLPRVFSKRTRLDAPVVATVVTAAMAIFFLLIGDPIWLVAAANFTYLIGIALPSVAVWLLRRDSPELPRPYRAHDISIKLGLFAAFAWFLATLLGFQQFGLPTVLFALVFAATGPVMYAIHRFFVRRGQGLPWWPNTLHLKLTGAMLLVLILDGAGYQLAVQSMPRQSGPLVSLLEDIFVAVAILTIAVGLVLPGIIAHSVEAVSEAAKRLSGGTIKELSRAMGALARGNIEEAHATIDIHPVRVRTQDEIGEMAASFNVLQEEVRHTAIELDGARQGLSKSRSALESTNRELLSFSYSISHDLRAPLRGIDGWSQALLEDYGDKLDGQGRVYLDRVRAEAQRMGQLIDAMLDLSRVHQAELQMAPVDLSAMATARLARLREAQPERQVEAVVQPGLHTVGDAGLLQAVLSNLLENAWKFTGKKNVARIEFGQTKENGEIIYFVRDNGAGFDPGFAAKMFAPFQRMHKQTEFPGTGIGLANAHRIIGRHGGRIWAESSVDNGATFSFTLPSRS